MVKCAILLMPRAGTGRREIAGLKVPSPRWGVTASGHRPPSLGSSTKDVRQFEQGAACFDGALVQAQRQDVNILAYTSRIHATGHRLPRRTRECAWAATPPSALKTPPADGTAFKGE